MKKGSDAFHFSMVEFVYQLFIISILVIGVLSNALSNKSNALSNQTATLRAVQADLVATINNAKILLDVATNTQQDLSNAKIELNQVSQKLAVAQEKLESTTTQLNARSGELERTQDDLRIATGELNLMNTRLSSAENNLEEVLQMVAIIEAQTKTVETILETESIAPESNESAIIPQLSKLQSLEEGLAALQQNLAEILEVTEEMEVELTRRIISQGCHQREELSIPAVLATITIVGPDLFTVEVEGNITTNDFDEIRDRFAEEIQISQREACFLLIRVKSGTNDYNIYSQGFNQLESWFYIVRVD